MHPIKDELDLLSMIDVFAVHTYLAGNGWQQEQVVANRHVILSNSRERRKYFVFLPLDKEVPDFSTRMFEVFRTLEAFERKQQLRVVANFVEPKKLEKYNNNK